MRRWSQGRMVLLDARSGNAIRIQRKTCVHVARKMFQEVNTSEIETDNFTTYPMSIEGVVAGILIMNRKRCENKFSLKEYYIQ